MNKCFEPWGSRVFQDSSVYELQLCMYENTGGSEWSIQVCSAKCCSQDSAVSALNYISPEGKTRFSQSVALPTFLQRSRASGSIYQCRPGINQTSRSIHIIIAFFCIFYTVYK